VNKGIKSIETRKQSQPAKAMLFRHSLSDKITQAEVLSAFKTIVAFSTLTQFYLT